MKRVLIPLLDNGTRFGAYEIVAHIATGGMGSVYRVRNVVTGSQRALKVMRPDLAKRPEFVSRFIREMTLAASIDHPNIVRVFDPGIEGEQLYLPMELLDGESFATRLNRVRRMPEAQVVSLLYVIGRAVIALHEKGIIHRDLKPSNIFLAQKDAAIVPKILDLGASKSLHMVGDETATGDAIGSTYYMSPEQACGVKDIDGRTDQYSLGVIAYKALTGAHPYEADDSGHPLAKLIRGAPFPPPRAIVPEISETVERAILRAMSTDPKARFPTIEAFLEALEVKGDAIHFDVANMVPTVSLPDEPTVVDDDALTIARPTEKRADVTAGAVVTAATTAARRRTVAAPWVIAAAALLFSAGAIASFLALRLRFAPTPPAQATMPPKATAEPTTAATVPSAIAQPTATASTPATAAVTAPTVTVRELPTAHLKPTPRSPPPARTQEKCVPSPGAPCLQ